MTLRRLGQLSAITIIGYYAAFTAVCWVLDLAFPGKLATQTRARVAFDAGAATGALAIWCSIVLWRSHRWTAVLGFLAFLLWAIWECLPRL